ncbi:STY4534 family ICE replication protein [Metapseudomonas furukawaii]|uniref:Periplasmic protein TonB n=1 Tax=Metapseudomonas furukawaii TaxID=1149133 RepID=A0AAD1BZM5_METFU|nr:STY4534 family ICE replication protein [Pseudomonas furukawaii]ELS26113.1 Periplasmic protein TonB [Pseudomonas furukawaii]BAU73218.1 periplasmic protein TonB [Pseudomonas furukawaii]BBJ01766.1 DUF3577 domain-containing protein [Pseudomonas furukawaii]
MTTSTEKSYFDLHITGLGYLNRIRDVKPKKGDAFLACDIAALNGPSVKPEYRRFDVRVSGSEAQHLIRRCEEAVKAERKVLIGFRLGDLWTDIFTYTKGKNEGKPGVSLKARLLFVSWIKIDGEMVYEAEPKTTDDAASEDAPAPSSASAAQDAPVSEAAINDDADAPAEAPALADSF